MNIFLIATPLQAINAIEACYALGISPADSIMIRCGSSSAINDRQLDAMLAQESWGANHHIPYKGASLTAWLGRMRRLNGLSRGMQECERLFIGDYGFDLARHFCNTMRPKQIVLLDDGSASLELILTQKDPTRAKYFYGPPFTTRRKLILKRLFGMRDKLLKGITYFTVYDEPPEPGSSVILNRYHRLKQTAPAVVDPATLFFLGNTRDDLSDDVYIGFVARALKQLKETPNRYYLPHRHENPARLERLTRELNLPCLRFDAPVEYAVCRLTATLPYLVGGFSSTAFDTLHAIFADRMKFRVFHLEQPLAVYERQYADIYAYYGRQYREPNFKIVVDY